MTTMAAKYISQGTFDDVVKENVVDFSMNVDEAKQETIKQFEAQGISLSNIIKDLSLNEETGAPLLNEAIASIKTQIGENTINPVELIECLSILDTECQKSIPHRVLASKNGAQDALITLLEQEFCAETKDARTANVGLLEWSLRAVNSLTNKQPDIFGAEALAVVIKLLDRYSREETVVCLTLQWLQKACIMHETNRQNIMSSTILKQLKPLLALKVDNVVREVMTVLRYLVLDDDIRVEFGCAHEHARIIASAFILDLTKLLGELQDINLLADLMLTIGTLAVRQELCTVIEDAGGLRLVLQIMLANPNSVRVNREALKLLRALAGNDTVKAHIVQQGAAPIITELLQTHMSNENVATAALACISTITLRVKENSTAFFQAGIAEPLVETMRLHAGSNTVQRNGAWAVRNMVSRSREQCETWLSYGLEDLLNAAMVEHVSVQQDIRAALRDLGCKVVLREEWTGTAEKKIAN